MSDHFNELLLQTLKEVGVRLERLEGRVDHVINEKANKIDVSDVKTDVNQLWDEVRSQGRRLDRIETGIRTLQWTMTAGLAVLGIILAFLKAF